MTTLSGPRTVDALLTKVGELIRERDAAITALRAWEQWEADIIMDDACWGPERMDETPRLTPELWDRVIELQRLRNAALKERDA